MNLGIAALIIKYLQMSRLQRFKARISIRRILSPSLSSTGTIQMAFGGAAG
jgi:hypothetical protein